MGFFGDLKQDLSQAVSEIAPEEPQSAGEQMTLDDLMAAETAAAEAPEEIQEGEPLSEDMEALLKEALGQEEAEMADAEPAADLDALLAEAESAAEAAMPEAEAAAEEIPELDLDAILAEAESSAGEAFREAEEAVVEEPVMEEIPETAAEEIPAEEPVIEEAVAEEIPAEEPVMEEIPEPAVEEPAPELDAVLEASLDEAFAPIEAPVREPEPEVTAQEPEAPAFETEYTYSASKGAEKEMDSVRDYSEETSVITGGMTINGDLETEGSLDLVGDVNGNVSVKGKLNVTGHINGNSQAKEVYAEGAKITGDISSETAVKIGTGTVIIGNISALSAAIAGAVKGDIDVHGPVILDSTAIVMGNIKSKSVQINNGAAIEGMCSQCYADVSPTSFFDEYKTEKKAAKGGKGAKNADTTEA